MIIADVDGSIQRTFAITVRATIVNNVPDFSQRNYRFRISENSRDNDEIGLIVVTDDTGILAHFLAHLWQLFLAATLSQECMGF